MEIRIHRKCNVAVVALSGSVEMISIRSEVIEVLEQEMQKGAKRLVVDLAEATFVSSSFCGYLVGIYTTAAQRDCKVSVVMPGRFPIFAEVFRATQLDTIIDGYLSMEDCLRSTGIGEVATAV